MQLYTFGGVVFQIPFPVKGFRDGQHYRRSHGLRTSAPGFDASTVGQGVHGKTKNIRTVSGADIFCRIRTD